MVYLEDFYESGKFYIFNKKTSIVEPTLEKVEQTNIDGYFSVESYGIMKKRYLSIAYFNLAGKEVLYIDGELVDFKDETLIIKKAQIIPFLIVKYTIIWENKIFICKQWMGRKEDAYSTNIFDILLSKLNNV